MDKLRLLLGCIRPLLARPSLLLPSLRALGRRYRSAGLNGVKIGLLEIRAGRLLHDKGDIWKAHLAQLERELKPAAPGLIGALRRRPLISVLLPTYNTPAGLLERTIGSVHAQWYPEWELCICDDASGDAGTLALLQRLEGRDPRIRIAHNPENRGIAATTNQALDMASGDYVVLLDHDDLLQPQALLRIAQCAQELGPDFIYSDEALISSRDDEVLDFFCRPAFSPELLRSQPYIVHLICFRRRFLAALGGLDETLAISQDYDLILRATERAQGIAHIPEILYLWRRLSSSAGHRMQSRVMATSSAILERHLARIGSSGRVTPGEFFNTFDLRYPLRPGLRVAILIPTRNCRELVQQCIASIEATVTGVDYQIVLIDHCSDDPQTLDWFQRQRPRCQVIRCEGGFNFSAINNWGVAGIEGEFSHYLFCNNDIEAIETGWLERLLELGQQEDVAVVGAKLLYPDRKRIQHAGVGVGIFAAAEHYGKFLEEWMPDGRHNPGYQGSLVCNHEVSAVTAACMLVHSSLFRELGGFDEHLRIGFGDTDLCLRARARGLRILFCPHATLLHHESYSRGVENEHPQDTALFRCRWRGYLEAGDPCYNPNLSTRSYSWEMRAQLPLTPALRVRTGAPLPPADCALLRNTTEALNP